MILATLQARAKLSIRQEQVDVVRAHEVLPLITERRSSANMASLSHLLMGLLTILVASISMMYGCWALGNLANIIIFMRLFSSFLATVTWAIISFSTARLLP